MNAYGKRILLVYANEYFLISPVYPFGLDIMAQYLEKEGHRVCIDLPFLSRQGPSSGIESAINDFKPDIIGVSIRNIDTAMSCDPSGTYRLKGIRTHFFLPGIARMIKTIKKCGPNIPVVLGGTGFSVSPEAIMAYTGADFGIVGQGCRPMSMFAGAFPSPERLEKIPNLVFGKQPVPETKNLTDLDLITGEKNRNFTHSFETIGMPVLTSYGCCMNCGYCVEPSMTGGKVIQRSEKEVVDELKHISENYEDVSEIFFVNTEFNTPTPEQSLNIIKEILFERLNERFRFSSQFLPIHFTEEYARLLSMAGFYVILTCDSFSDEVLAKNNSPYREKDIVQTLSLFEQYKVPCTLNLIFGLPGECFGSIDHTTEMVNKYALPGLFKFEYTSGARIYKNTGLARYIENNPVKNRIHGNVSKGYTEPCFFSSPASPEALNAHIEARLSYKQAFVATSVEDNRAFREAVYEADRGFFEKACKLFSGANIRSKVSMYEYLFRKFAQNGQRILAKQITMDYISSLEKEDPDRAYADSLPVAQYFLSLL